MPWCSGRCFLKPHHQTDPCCFMHIDSNCLSVQCTSGTSVLKQHAMEQWALLSQAPPPDRSVLLHAHCLLLMSYQRVSSLSCCSGTAFSSATLLDRCSWQSEQSCRGGGKCRQGAEETRPMGSKSTQFWGGCKGVTAAPPAPVFHRPDLCGILFIGSNGC